MESFNEPKVLKECIKRIYNPKYPNNSIHNNMMGYEGESDVEYHLKRSNIGMYIMNDINLSKDEFSAQVDFVVVTSHHCYFIECKNFNVKTIHVDENGYFEKSMHGRYGMKSPIFQADEQLVLFEKIITKDKENTDRIFNGVDLKNYFKTVVVFTNPENRLNLKNAPADIKYRVLKIDGLIRQIEYDDNHSSIHISKEQMLEIANYFLDNDITHNPIANSNKIDDTIMDTSEITREALYKNEIINDTKPEKFNYKSDINDVYFRRGFKKNDFNKKSYYNRKQKNNNDDSKYSLIKTIVLLLIAMWILGVAFSKPLSNSSNTDSGYDTMQPNSNINPTNTTKQVSSKSLNDNTINALNNLKNAYNNAKQYGFDLYDYNSCLYLKESLFDSLTCSGKPMQVNYISDNNISIYKNFNCYYLKYDLNNKKIISSSQKYVGYNNECPGKDIGLIHYDSTNQYLAKIGGYNKILRMARYAYNKTSGFDGYYDFSHISERGGNPNLTTTYKTVVDDYFRTISNKCVSCQSNSLEEFNKMVEYFYYIMRK